MFRHKYDGRNGRNASGEGALAQKTYDETCLAYGIKFREANRREDCSGIDRFHENGVEVDVKARKDRKRLPANAAWVEMSKYGPDKLGTGWVNKDNKYIAQMMIYEENNKIIDIIFGIYKTNDMADLLQDKVDFTSQASKGTLYELYTRYEGAEPRGTMTVVTYKDIESLPSFKKMEVPIDLWPALKEWYKYA